jgi:hypothetical protein
VEVKELIELHPDTDYKLAACACVNPLTAASFIDIAKVTVLTQP